MTKLCAGCGMIWGHHSPDCRLHPLNNVGGKAPQKAPAPENVPVPRTPTVDTVNRLKDQVTTQYAKRAAVAEELEQVTAERDALKAEVDELKLKVGGLWADNQFAQADLTKAQDRIDYLSEALRKIAVRDFPKAGLRMVAKQALNGALPPKCVTCKGTGQEADGAAHTCTACNGSGESKPC